jgi:hypothetical protein
MEIPPSPLLNAQLKRSTTNVGALFVTVPEAVKDDVDDESIYCICRSDFYEGIFAMVKLETVENARGFELSTHLEEKMFMLSPINFCWKVLSLSFKLKR